MISSMRIKAFILVNSRLVHYKQSWNFLSPILKLRRQRRSILHWKTKSTLITLLYNLYQDRLMKYKLKIALVQDLNNFSNNTQQKHPHLSIEYNLVNKNLNPNQIC